MKRSHKTRNLDFIFDFFQDAQAFLDARPAKTANRGAVGFVVTGFKISGKPECPGTTPLMISAMRMACSSLSITQGRPCRKTFRADADVADLERKKSKAKPFTAEHEETSAETKTI